MSPGCLHVGCRTDPYYDLGMLTLETPTRLRITGSFQGIWSAGELAKLRMHLSYIDKSNDYAIHKLKKSPWASKENIKELEAARKQCLLFEDEHGFYTNSGMTGALLKAGFGPGLNQVVYPDPTPLAWLEKPINEMWPFQATSLELLLAAKHGAVEIATGLGKTFIILHLVRQLGLKTVVMAPSISIANQILADFTKYLGRKYVGQFFDGKKESHKKIVIAVAASLNNIDVNSDVDNEHYINLSKTDVFVADESHQCAAKTLASICLTLMIDVPYRFFFSATQLRNDGQELLLTSIIGPTVYSMTLQEGVDQGYLAKPEFYMVELESRVNFKSADPNKMTRRHLLYNPDVIKEAANIANSTCHLGQQVLILIDELEQFAHLLPNLQFRAGFAHAAQGKSKAKIAPAFQKSDPTALVTEFNAGKLPILIGTSCIGCGTDVKANAVTINLVGGRSEIQVRQGAIGRSTRKHPTVKKTTCSIIDFDVVNVPITHRHAKERAAIYDYEYGPVRRVQASLS